MLNCNHSFGGIMNELTALELVVVVTAITVCICILIEQVAEYKRLTGDDE